MDSPGLVILGVLAVGVILVVIPVVLTTLSEHRSPRSVVCPETGGTARIGIDAGGAARSSILGRVRLSVQGCSLWPERQGCAQSCTSTVEEPAPLALAGEDGPGAQG